MHSTCERIPGFSTTYLGGRLPATERRQGNSFAPASAAAGTVAALGFAARNTVRLFLPAVVSVVLLWPAQPALADFAQQGNKLVGTGGVGLPPQDNSPGVFAGGDNPVGAGANNQKRDRRGRGGCPPRGGGG